MCQPGGGEGDFVCGVPAHNWTASGSWLWVPAGPTQPFFPFFANGHFHTTRGLQQRGPASPPWPWPPPWPPPRHSPRVPAAVPPQPPALPADHCGDAADAGRELGPQLALTPNRTKHHHCNPIRTVIAAAPCPLKEHPLRCGRRPASLSTAGKHCVALRRDHVYPCVAHQVEAILICVAVTPVEGQSDRASKFCPWSNTKTEHFILHSHRFCFWE